MRTSYSALETFVQCPQKYKFQEIEKIKAAKSKEAVFGTLVHEALKYMHTKDPLFPSLDEVLAHFRSSISASTLAKTELERFTSLGITLLQRYWKQNPPWNFNIIDLESRFEVEIADAKTGTKHTIAGIIDRIDKKADNRFEIIDYKTSRRLPSQKEVEENLQLSLYHFAVTNRWPHVNPEDIELSLYFLRAGEKLSTNRDSMKLQETTEQIQAKISAIEEAKLRDNFPPKPSALCEWCAFKPLCPAWKYLYRDKKGEDISEKEIETIANEFLALKDSMAADKKKAAELSQKIEWYLEKNNLTRLFGEQGIVSRSQQERTNWNTNLIDTLLKNTEIWKSVSTVDPKKLLDYFDKLPREIQKTIDEKGREKKLISTIKVSKKKERSEEDIN